MDDRLSLCGQFSQTILSGASTKGIQNICAFSENTSCIDGEQKKRKEKNNFRNKFIKHKKTVVVVIYNDSIYGCQIMIIDFKLTYPSGTATAHLINSFHTPQGAKLAK